MAATPQRSNVRSATPAASLAAREQFATNLKHARQQAGLSQEALGLEIDLHRTEISLLERAERDPRLATIVKLAAGLGIDAKELLNGV